MLWGLTQMLWLSLNCATLWHLERERGSDYTTTTQPLERRAAHTWQVLPSARQRKWVVQTHYLSPQCLRAASSELREKIQNTDWKWNWWPTAQFSGQSKNAGLNEEQKKATPHEKLYVLVHFTLFCVCLCFPENQEPRNSYVYLCETVASVLINEHLSYLCALVYSTCEIIM